jgi:hypothetical protein
MPIHWLLSEFPARSLFPYFIGRCWQRVENSKIGHARELLSVEHVVGINRRARAPHHKFGSVMPQGASMRSHWEMLFNWWCWKKALRGWCKESSQAIHGSEQLFICASYAQLFICAFFYKRNQKSLVYTWIWNYICKCNFRYGYPWT